MIEFQARTVRLRDASEVTVRAIREDDADRLQEAITSLSAEGRYLRFFSSMDRLTPKLLDRATHPDGRTEVQLVAVVGAGADERIVAGSRFSPTETDGDCEFAIAVLDEWQGRGLARHLLETLIPAARERGFARMEGFILHSNEAMLGLAKRLGFEKQPSTQGPEVCFVRMDLGVRRPVS